MGLKIIHLGESGSGKTCALISLLRAGYSIRLIDTDNNLHAFLNLLSKEPPEVQRRFAYLIITERTRISAGRIIPAKANMWPDVVRTLGDWKNDDPSRGTVANLGSMDSWDENTIFVQDTLSSLSQGALHFGQMMNGVLGQPRTSREAQRDVGGAQSLIRDFLMLCCDSTIKCHIIVNTHITYVRKDGSGILVIGDQDNIPTQGMPSAIGRAVLPEIPRGFNTILLSECMGSGPAIRRTIHTVTRGNILLKNAAPTVVPPELPQESGLATYFKLVLGRDPLKPAQGASH